MTERHREEVLELARALGELVGATHRRRGRDTRAPRDGLAFAHFRTLFVLGAAEGGASTVGELAERTGLSPGAVTQALDRLEELQLVGRQRSGSDRRVVVAQLTRDGRRRMEERREKWLAAVEDAVGDLDASQLELAGDVMRRLARLVEEV